VTRASMVLHHWRNYGLGRTHSHGFENARSEWILYTTGTIRFDLLELLKNGSAGSHVRSLDRVFGTIATKGSQVVLSRVYRFTVGNCPWACTSATSIVLSSSSVERCSEKYCFRPRGRSSVPSWSAKSIHAGFRVREVGISYRPRQFGESTLSGVAK